MRVQFLAQLLQKMEQDQVYKNGDFKLAILAESPHHLAACMLLGGITLLKRRETSNVAGSALTKWVTAFLPNFSIKSRSFRR